MTVNQPKESPLKSIRRFALIGYGAIGEEIGRAVCGAGERDCVACVLVRPGRLADSFPAVHDIPALVAAAPDVVLECAGHGAVRDYGEAVLAAGLDLVITSVGALADDDVARALLRAAEAGGGRLLIAPGAVAGLDGLIAGRLAGLTRVTYTSYKPPEAWRGTAAEAVLDLDHPEVDRVVFEGSARDAARAYPKNANVSISIGLCGLGIDRTQVRLVSSRAVADPRGVIEAEGAFGRFVFDILGLAAPNNPKTSLLTAYSLLQCARLGQGLPVAALLDPP
jgi:aspartate dehydrogenase